MVDLPLWWVLLLALLAFLGTVGNVFIIGAVFANESLRRRGNAFIVNLALADLVITCYIMPIGLATSQYKENPFDQSVCDVNAFLIMTSCGVSTHSLMLIALERYFYICKGMHYPRVFRPLLVTLYIILVWFYCMAWTSQGWTGWTKYTFAGDAFVCLFSGPYSLSYSICLVIFGMLTPMIVLAFSYTSIFRKVHQSNARIAAHRRRYGLQASSMDSVYISRPTDRNVKNEIGFVMTLFIIVIAFMVFWLPACIILPLSGLWSEMPHILYTVAVWFALCNSCINSFLYGILNKNFRRGYVQILRKLFCCNNNRAKCDCNSVLLRAGEDTASTATSPMSVSRASARSYSSTRESTQRPPRNTIDPLSRQPRGEIMTIAEVSNEEYPDREGPVQ